MYYEDAETQITEKMRLETARILFEAVPKKRTKVVSEAKLRTLKREQGDNP